VIDGAKIRNNKPSALKSLANLSASYPPAVCGIYFLCKGEEVVYVGKSRNVFGRATGHRSSNVFGRATRNQDRKDYDRWYWVPVSRQKLNEVERRWITELKPLYNLGPRRGKRIKNAPRLVEPPGIINHERIKELRNDRGLTMTEAALKAGWGKWGVPRWSLIERGIRKVIAIRTLDEMAAVLGCDARELLTEQDLAPEKAGKRIFKKERF
jgi:hypothetical protein